MPLYISCRREVAKSSTVLIVIMTSTISCSFRGLNVLLFVSNAILRALSLSPPTSLWKCSCIVHGRTDGTFCNFWLQSSTTIDVRTSSSSSSSSFIIEYCFFMPSFSIFFLCCMIHAWRHGWYILQLLTSVVNYWRMDIINVIEYVLAAVWCYHLYYCNKLGLVVQQFQKKANEKRYTCIPQQ